MDPGASAAAVLRANDNGGYTVPSRATYPHQWNWDSALAALGWAELDAARAWTELDTLAGARDRRGMIPHIAFHTRVPDRLGARLRGALTLVARPYARYLPGPRWWGRRLSNYWRGPVWTNVTWLVALALDGHGEAAIAAELRRRMLLAVEDAGMREYFAPESGRGLGAEDFAWTAALYLRESHLH